MQSCGTSLLPWEVFVQRFCLTSYNLLEPGWPGDASGSDSLNQVITRIDGESSRLFFLKLSFVPPRMIPLPTFDRAVCGEVRSLGGGRETWTGSHLGCLPFQVLPLAYPFRSNHQLILPDALISVTLIDICIGIGRPTQSNFGHMWLMLKMTKQISMNKRWFNLSFQPQTDPVEFCADLSDALWSLPSSTATSFTPSIPFACLV